MIKKVFPLLLALMAGCNQLSFADYSSQITYPQQQMYVYDDFTKLDYSNYSAYKVPESAGVVAQNLRANLSVSTISKRLPLIKAGADGTGEVTGLYRYYNTNGNKYLLATSTTFLDYVDDTTGTATHIRSGLTSGKRWQFQTYKNIVIGMNGYDNAQKWDGTTQVTANTTGSRTSGLLSADLGAPFATQLMGSNLTASKWYQYRIAYYDGTNYTYSTDRSNPILTGTSVKDITLTDIPLGPVGTTQRIIYRNQGDNSQAAVQADTTFYKVATISDNITRTYADHIADATTIADAAPTWATVSAGNNVTVPKGRFNTIHQERLWIGGDPNNNSYLYYSDILNPDYFLTTAYAQVRPDDGDKITFLLDFLGILTIGKTNTISKYYTDDPSPANWVLSNPYSFVGCPAPYTAVATPLGIIYVGRDGIYQFTGQTSQLISDVVTDKVRDFNQVNIEDFAGIFFRNEYHLAYTSSASGSATNDQVLVLDTIRNAYEIDTANISSWAVLASGTDFGVLLSGSSNNGYIYSHNSAPTVLVEKTLSDLQAGTVSYVDIVGTEDDPSMQLGWGSNWGSVAALHWSSLSGTWAIQSQTGSWTSPAIQINAASLDKLYWNATTNNGTVTWAIKTASASGGIPGASWSSEFSNQSGSDVSAVTGNVWVQLRATLTTNDTSTTPVLYLADNYVVKLAYNGTGTNKEAAFLTLFRSGFNNYGHPGFPKRIRAVDVYYTGTTGTLNVGFNNSEGDISLAIPIDLSRAPVAGMKQIYKGTANGGKIYHFEPPANSATNSSPVGENWQLTINENGNTPWAIQRIVVSYDVLNRQVQ